MSDSMIVINGQDYSVNNRGLSIVVTKRATGEEIDSVCFDCLASYLTEKKRLKLGICGYFTRGRMRCSEIDYS